MSQSDPLAGCYPLQVDGHTGVLGVFGYPVGHSLSPAMHNAAIAALGLHYIYIPFSVQPEQIGPAVRSLVPLGIIGVNLTIPHKERVLPFLDEIAPEASAVGAVNTVHHVDGRLIGHNTDGEGFVAPLRAAGEPLSGRSVVVLGAGGAARSVVCRLAQEGASVTIVNRTAERAARLADDVDRLTGRRCVKSIPFETVRDVREALADATLLVNTTSVGMSPRQDEMPPIPPEGLHAGLLVYELIYNPVETRLLACAREAGARTLNGVKMLVGQGAASFRIWTGVTPPADVMERSVVQQLARRAEASSV